MTDHTELSAMGAVSSMCCGPQHCDPYCGEDPFKTLGLVGPFQFSTLSVLRLLYEIRKSTNAESFSYPGNTRLG